MCTQPAVSLNSATTTGPGAATDLGRNYAHHTMIVSASGSGSAQVTLEFSHDGTVWTGANSANANGGGFPTSTHGDRVARYVRANITSFSGGSPSVTATVASA